MEQYITIPFIIKAAEWNGKFRKDARVFTQKHEMPSFTIGSISGTTGLIIPTLEGDRVAARGDFIIKDRKGEYYPCKPDVFKEKYHLEKDWLQA